MVSRNKWSVSAMWWGSRLVKKITPHFWIHLLPLYVAGHDTVVAAWQATISPVSRLLEIRKAQERKLRALISE